ncbi:hypothetical protein Nepgr_020457 [Nepenthes gracilis]|uniref:Uncharacterized protein n=1 Tax=Nepenthes gracilis TaxID=150966 RepID=A0AAD3XWD7_NEPGR|nr:hypothetical protein Nepgr_020457 [Nepenthes gracilis]
MTQLQQCHFSNVTSAMPQQKKQTKFIKRLHHHTQYPGSNTNIRFSSTPAVAGSKDSDISAAGPAGAGPTTAAANQLQQ